MPTNLPYKTRDIRNVICDSTRWNDVVFRDDDIVIATVGKTGSTWTQQIVGNLVLGGADGLLARESPWIDHTVAPIERILAQVEAQTHRRFLKTHLPVDALGIDPRVKYIYTARDARDAVWSMHHHARRFSAAAYAHYNDRPDRIGPPLVPPPEEPREFYHAFLKTGGMPLIAGGIAAWPFWEHIQGWWDLRHLPNVLLVHYANLKADTPREMRRIARHLDITIDEAAFPRMVEHCGFQYMQDAAAKVEFFDIFFEGGGRVFVNKGTNGRWKDVLTPEEIAAGDEEAAKRLTPACAHWLKTGELPSA